MDGQPENLIPDCPRHQDVTQTWVFTIFSSKSSQRNEFPPQKTDRVSVARTFSQGRTAAGQQDATFGLPTATVTVGLQGI